MAQKTYRHLVAGSTIIFKSGKTAVFHGKKGSVGFYSTEDKEEIDALDTIVKSPIVQIEEVTVPTSQSEEFSKPLDPAIAKSAEDAAENTMMDANPAISAARSRLSAVIANNKE